MISGNIIAYNVAVFISTLFLLEFGADKFVAHTAIVARRTGIPATIIALLTAGAEWEELAVVLASLAQNRSSLAIGNIIGSAISNLLGAFSLGLLFRPNGSTVQFDRSSRIYSLLLLVITTLITPLAHFSNRITWLAGGAVLIAFFAAYLVSIGWAISKGALGAPEDSDSDSDGDSDSGSNDESEASSERTPILRQAQTSTLGANADSPHGQAAITAHTSQRTNRREKSLSYHSVALFTGFAAISLAGYVLSHAATNVTDAIGVSDVLFGVTFLAITTTLPEKFVAVLSGKKSQIGILVANTAGSNIFLMSLCLGIIMLNTAGNFNGGNVSITELVILWSSTLAFTLTVWFGARFDRWIGGAMLVGYIAFIIVEFTVRVG